MVEWESNNASISKNFDPIFVKIKMGSNETEPQLLTSLLQRFLLFYWYSSNIDRTTIGHSFIKIFSEKFHSHEGKRWSRNVPCNSGDATPKHPLNSFLSPYIVNCIQPTIIPKYNR